MRLPFALLLCITSLAAAQHSTIRFGSPKPLPKAPGHIRLATYNLENLYDSVDDPALTGQYEDMNSVKPEEQLKGLAAAIRALDADILAVQEVESEAVLRWFRDTYLEDLGYTYLASIDAGDERGIEQGVLSRFPISSAVNWPGQELAGTQPDRAGDRANPLAGQPLRFHRSPLKVVIDISHAAAGPAGVPPAPKAYTLTLFVVHQKSGRFYDYWRSAEAAGLVTLIADAQSADPRANIAILGDFNAVHSDAPVQTVGSGGLIDLFADLRGDGADARYITHESGRSIDYIFVNPGLRSEVIASSRFILGTPARPAGMDYRTAPIPPGYGSDHYPVAVDLRPVESDTEQHP